MNAVVSPPKTLPTTEVIQNGQILTARPISVEEYDRMIEHGILTAEDRVELINGALIEKMPKGIAHAALNDSVAELLREKLDGRVVIRNRNPIVLDDFSEPEPDIAVCRPPREKYFKAHPTPADILLSIEISDTTLERDRFVKGSLYAKAGIPQYLTLNVQEEIVEDYREPSADGYQSKQTHRKGEAFNLLGFPDIEPADLL